MPGPDCNVIEAALTVPTTVRTAPSFTLRSPAVDTGPRNSIWLVSWNVPVRLTAPGALTDRLPATSVPVSAIPPVVAIRLVAPPPPSVTTPGIATSLPARAICVALMLPPMVSGPPATMVALLPPLIGPVTDSPDASFRVKPVVALKPAKMAI